MIIPTSLFHAVILFNIALAVVLTAVLFAKEKQYPPGLFFLMIVLLWAVPVLGVLIVSVLMVTRRVKPLPKN